MRPHSAFSLISLLFLAMLLGLGPLIAGRAQEATREATPTALAWSACTDAGGWECATLPVPLEDPLPIADDASSVPAADRTASATGVDQNSAPIEAERVAEAVAEPVAELVAEVVVEPVDAEAAAPVTEQP